MYSYSLFLIIISRLIPRSLGVKWSDRISYDSKGLEPIIIEYTPRHINCTELPLGIMVPSIFSKWYVKYRIVSKLGDALLLMYASGGVFISSIMVSWWRPLKEGEWSLCPCALRLDIIMKHYAAKTQDFVSREPWAELNTVVGMAIKLPNPTK